MTMSDYQELDMAPICHRCDKVMTFVKEIENKISKTYSLLYVCDCGGRRKIDGRIHG